MHLKYRKKKLPDHDFITPSVFIYVTEDQTR